MNPEDINSQLKDIQREIDEIKHNPVDSIEIDAIRGIIFERESSVETTEDVNVSGDPETLTLARTPSGCLEVQWKGRRYYIPFYSS